MRVRVGLGEVIGQRQRVVIVARGRIDKSGIRDTRRRRPREGRVGLRRGVGTEMPQAHCWWWCCCCWQACRVSLFFSKHLARAVRCGAMRRQASRPPLLHRLHRPRNCTQVVNSSSSSLFTRSRAVVLCSLTDVHSCPPRCGRFATVTHRRCWFSINGQRRNMYTGFGRRSAKALRRIKTKHNPVHLSPHTL